MARRTCCDLLLVNALDQRKKMTQSRLMKTVAWLFICVVIVIWAYLPTWQNLARVWSGNAQYSHGYFIPLIALGILWHRRALLSAADFRPNLFGLLLLLLGGAMRLASARYFVNTIDEYSIFPTLAGLALTLGGTKTLRWCWPAIAFLWFMIPLHGRVSGLLSEKLQRIATITSAHLIETAGFPAQTEGNVILLSEVDMGIIEACNGLAMMMTFFAISTAAAIFIDTVAWKKVALVLGAVPIAVACNVLRIATTGIMHETVGREWADKVFHDLAGWLMMPLGLFFLWLELSFLDRLVPPVALKNNGSR